jgi:putative addiction module component (TIGR02574 family)
MRLEWLMTPIGLVEHKTMDSKSRAVLDAALELSEGDRAKIAEKLLETLAPEGAERLDDDLASELEARLEECRNDPKATVSWAQLKKRSGTARK